MLSLRYHLGLVTPSSDDCFINVDGVPYSWRDGEAFLFDETYLHYARNDSDQYRLIL
ncbi:MAG: aspartyl/asparaginyl beta-hydroxylase domain-containing protein, partial [Gammaproteobacteria bacterium]